MAFSAIQHIHFKTCRYRRVEKSTVVFSPLTEIRQILLLYTACQNKTYGAGCTNDCGRCANENACDIRDGTCPDGCMPGYLLEGCSKRKLSLCSLLFLVVFVRGREQFLLKFRNKYIVQLLFNFCKRIFAIIYFLFSFLCNH